jgi:DNA-binding transcriptional ArsR family regulator
MLNHSCSGETHLDHAFAALSDPTRRTMLARLSRGPASVSELARPLRMSLPAVLQHLQALEASGLVGSAKAGRVRTVRLQPGVMTDAEQWLTATRNAWEAQADRLEQYVETMKGKENKNAPRS